LSDVAQRYADAVLANPAFRAWEEAGAKEPWTIAQTEAV